MISLMRAGPLAAAIAMAPPAAAQAVQLVTKVLVETRKPAADGTTRIELATAARVTPGDRVVYQIIYRNPGREAARDLVIANPIPAGLVYAGAAHGSTEPGCTRWPGRWRPAAGRERSTGTTARSSATG